MISACQLQEKYLEHHVALYQVFVDITKTFYYINRGTLWIILSKVGCPSDFVRMFKQFQRKMKGLFNFNMSPLLPIAIDNEV